MPPSVCPLHRRRRRSARLMPGAAPSPLTSRSQASAAGRRLAAAEPAEAERAKHVMAWAASAASSSAAPLMLTPGWPAVCEGGGEPNEQPVDGQVARSVQCTSGASLSRCLCCLRSHHSRLIQRQAVQQPATNPAARPAALDSLRACPMLRYGLQSTTSAIPARQGLALPHPPAAPPPPPPAGQPLERACCSRPAGRRGPCGQARMPCSRVSSGVSSSGPPFQRQRRQQQRGRGRGCPPARRPSRSSSSAFAACAAARWSWCCQRGMASGGTCAASAAIPTTK